MRFPEFKGEWDEILIGDKFDFFSTNSLSRAKLDEESGEILNIHYGDIHTKFPSIVNVKKVRIPFVSEEVDTNKINKYELCKNGDILIADASEDYADIGKTIELQGITYEKIIGGLHTLLLRDKTTNVSPLFNGYLFQNEKLKKQIKIKANGISVLGISKKELQKISIKIPSIEEQKKISNLLFAIDQKLSFMETKLKNYTEIIYSIRNTIYTNIPNPIKCEIKDIANIIKGKQLNKEDMNDDAKYYVLNGGKLPSGNTDEWNVKENTITISEGGESCGYVNYNEEKFYCGGHCYYLELKNEINNYYIFNYLKFREPDIMRLRVGSGLPNIQKKDLLKLKIEIHEHNQEKIGTLLQLIVNKSLHLKNEIKIYKKFKNSLLSSMFC